MAAERLTPSPASSSCGLDLCGHYCAGPHIKDHWSTQINVFESVEYGYTYLPLVINMVAADNRYKPEPGYQTLRVSVIGRAKQIISRPIILDCAANWLNRAGSSREYEVRVALL